MADTTAAYLASATEKQVQASIVQGLTLLGYTVLQVGQARIKVRCPSCCKWHTPRGYVGTDTGVPDLYFRHARWPQGVQIGIEVKTATGILRPRQRVLHEAGATWLARCWEDVERRLDETRWLVEEERA